MSNQTTSPVVNEKAALAALAIYIKADKTSAAALVEALFNAGAHTPALARPLAVKACGLHYGVPLVVSSSPTNKGAEVLDAKANAFHAADRQLRRIMDLLREKGGAPVEKAHTAPVRLSKAQTELVVALAALPANVAREIAKRAAAIRKA